MANPGERSINIVTENKPKVLRGLSQKGHCSGHKDSPLPCHGHPTLPVDRARLTHPYVAETEHENPVHSPQESEPWRAHDVRA
jgi:hypothetical protein